MSGGFHPSQDDIHNLEAQRSHQNAQPAAGAPAPQGSSGPQLPSHSGQFSNPPASHYSDMNQDELAHAHKEYNHHRPRATYHPPTPSDEEMERIKNALENPPVQQESSEVQDDETPQG